MSRSAEKSIERLSLHYRREGKTVRHTSNRGLAVMAFSLEHGHNASYSDLRQLYQSIGGSRDLSEIDRRSLYRYVSRVYRHLAGKERLLLSPRYVRLGYALWSRGHGIYRYGVYLRSLNRYVSCRRVTDLGVYEISETIRKIRREGLRNAYGRIAERGYDREVDR